MTPFRTCPEPHGEATIPDSSMHFPPSAGELTVAQSESARPAGIDKDHLVATRQGLVLSSAAIVGIVVASLFVTLLIVDLSCFFVNQAGLFYLICGSKKKSAQEENKLTSEEKELLRENGKAKVELMDERLKKETKLTYDDKNSSVRTTFVGKDSAV